MMLRFIVLLMVCGLVPGSSAHDQPIIGVLTQEISSVFEMLYPGKYQSFIAASYVKWVESGGARVVPIWIGRDKEYYHDVMAKINGVLLPGGKVDHRVKGGYGETLNWLGSFWELEFE
jgi:gamma-glutamyl hydrolase